MTLLLAFCTIITILCLWAIICNERTFWERYVLIERAYDRAISGEIVIWPREIMSYEKHLWLKMTFRNAMKRYDDE